MGRNHNKRVRGLSYTRSGGYAIMRHPQQYEAYGPVEEPYLDYLDPGQTQLTRFPQTARSPGDIRDSGRQHQGSHHHGDQYEHQLNGYPLQYQGSHQHGAHHHGGQYEHQLNGYPLQYQGSHQHGGHHHGGSDGQEGNDRQRNDDYYDPRNEAYYGRSGLGRGAGAGNLHVMDSEAPGRGRNGNGGRNPQHPQHHQHQHLMPIHEELSVGSGERLPQHLLDLVARQEQDAQDLMTKRERLLKGYGTGCMPGR